MAAKKGLLQRIRGWFSGDDKKTVKQSAKPKSVIPQTRHGVSKGTVRRGLLDTLNGKNDDGKPSYKSMAEATKGNKGLNDAINAKTDKYLNMQKSVKKEPPKANLEATSAQKKAYEEFYTQDKERQKTWADNRAKNKARRKEELAEINRVTGNKYNAKTGDKKHDAEARRRIKSGEWIGDPELAKTSVKYHPVAESAARGALSGATFGASELAIKKLPTSKEMREAEEYYQANKNKTAETVGEIAGSLVGFGGATKGATRAAEKMLATEAGEKALEYGAKAFAKAGEREALRQIEKGVLKTTTKGAAEQIAKSKAKKVASALLEDALINTTVGGAYDFNKATSQYEIGSDEWWKEMRNAALFNLGAGTLATGIANRGATKEALETLAKREAKEAAEREGRRFLQARGSSGNMLDGFNFKGAKESAENLPTANYLRQMPEAPEIKPALEAEEFGRTAKAKKPRTKELGGIDVRKPENLTEQEKMNLASLKDSIEKTIANVEGEAVGKTDESKLLRRQAKKIDNVLNKANGVEASGKSEAKQVTVQDLINENNAEMAGKTTKGAETVGDNVAENTAKAETKAEAKAQKPKTKKQKAQAEAQERSMLDSVQRKREAVMDEQIRKQTKGEYGYRKGEHTSTANVSMEQARRNEQQQKSVLKKLKEKGVDSLFEDDSRPFGMFKTANRAEMERASREATTRVREDPYAVMKRLRELDARLIAEADKSALTSAEHITFDDIADITAIEQMFEEAGVQIPKEYEEAFSHIMEWQGTEAGQMLKMRDLFLKETSKAYRKKLISRDVDKYLRKVLNMDDVAIADLKRSLDANYGEGYFDKMVEELSKFKGMKDEAAFRKAYADFQADIFMNTKPTVWDTVNLWRHSFMLSSPKTGFNNIIGNLMQRAMYRISDTMNLAGESIAKAINPDVKRTTAVLKSKDQRRLANMYTNGRRGQFNLKNADYLKGFDDQAFADIINTAADADVSDMMASSKYMGDVVKGLKYKPETAAGKVKQGFVKGGKMGSEYVSIMLNEPDSWFVERNYRSALLKYLEANGVNSAETLGTKEGEKLLKEARAYAKDIALENTYKKANNVVEFLEGLRRKGHTKGSNAGYKAAAIMLDAELPYLKVPANLIVNNFKYSPLGLGKGAIDAFRGVVKGDAELLNQATRELSKGLTGTGMAALGYMMFCRDQMDDDSWGFVANADDSLKEYGMRDNSFKIGDHTFNISNMGIGSVQFLMGASLAEDLAAEDATPSHQVALDALSKTVDTVADMSLMENAVSLLDLFGNGGDYDMTVSQRLGNAATEVAGDYAAQFIPNPLRGVAKGMTDADLDTGVKKGDTTKVQRVLERNKNNFVQGLPVLNEKLLPHKVDSHGNLVNERNTAGDKLNAVLNNTLNPLTATKINIPEADKEELKVTRENGEKFKPKGFDPNRKYQAQIGSGDTKEVIDLTGKEREQVARSAKNSGYDGAMNLVKKGMFGDRLGERAQKVLREIPDDEEKAREYIFSTPEWKNASNSQKETWLKSWYGEDSHGKGVDRTRSREAYVNIAGNSEDDFRWQNDITPKNQQKYNEYGLTDVGISKGQWVDILESCADTNHKWNEETLKNQDTINSAKKTKNGILAVEGLTPEQRIAAYNVIRGKRTGFGWDDWDGVTSYGSGYRRGYGGYRRRGGGSRKVAMPKAKSMASATRSAKGTTVKLEPPTPKTTKVTTKFKEYKI